MPGRRQDANLERDLHAALLPSGPCRSHAPGSQSCRAAAAAPWQQHHLQPPRVGCCIAAEGTCQR
eukprot:1151273-Pelagomonas_calceolata.AAC.9